MTTTARLGMDIPQSSELISAYPAEAAQALGILDNAVLTTSGTLASRPATPEAGHRYYATDVARTYIYAGGVWVLDLTADTAYQALSRVSGVGAVAGDYAPSARFEGDGVKFRGSLTNTSGSPIAATTAIFTTPTGMVPSAGAAALIAADTYGTTATALLLAVAATTGIVTLSTSSPAWPANFVLPLNGLSFSLI